MEWCLWRCRVGIMYGDASRAVWRNYGLEFNEAVSSWSKYEGMEDYQASLPLQLTSPWA